jgi:CRISPR-associated protein, Cse3 family
MYLSCLLINVGDDPDRHRPGRLWLRNRYHVHQRLCMAFPSDPRKKRDPEFLIPYDQDDFPEQRHLADRKKNEVEYDALKQVHSPRNDEAGFLFRIDPLCNGRVMIIVQSAIEPDWDYAFHNADYLLAAPPEVKSFDPVFSKGQRLRFRLLANPTQKKATLPKRRWNTMSQEEQNKEKTRHGKRVPVPSSQEIDDWRGKHQGEDPRTFVHEKLHEWLANWRLMRNGRTIDSAGFAIDPNFTIVQPGYVYINKEGKGQGKRLHSARYEGILTVDNPELFKETLIRGIGSGKAFGFGLLSVAPANASGEGGRTCE